MSLPTFPTINPQLTTKDSLNMILKSVAMEELALSHIINAEGEKLQYILGTLDDGCPDKKTNIEEILEVNKSVKNMLDSISQNQMILKGKMECAIEALKECGYCKRGTADHEEPSEHNRHCHAAAFQGLSQQCRKAGQPIKWQHSKYSIPGSFYLSEDGEKISLKKNKCYSVSFSIDLSSVCNENLSISIQTYGCKTTLDRFIYHTQINESRAFTASASGIFVETYNYPTDLMLTILSPAAVNINQSSISINELF